MEHTVHLRLWIFSILELRNVWEIGFFRQSEFPSQINWKSHVFQIFYEKKKKALKNSFALKLLSLKWRRNAVIFQFFFISFVYITILIL